MTPLPPYASVSCGRERLQHNLALTAAPIIELPQMLHPRNTAAAIERQPFAVVCRACYVPGSLVADQRTQCRMLDTPSQADIKPEPIEKALN